MLCVSSFPNADAKTNFYYATYKPNITPKIKELTNSLKTNNKRYNRRKYTKNKNKITQ